MRYVTSGVRPTGGDSGNGASNDVTAIQSVINARGFCQHRKLVSVGPTQSGDGDIAFAAS